MEETNKILKDILFQLHAISAQNYMGAALSSDDHLKDYGLKGLEAETQWMKAFLEAKGGIPECPSWTGFSSDS